MDPLTDLDRAIREAMHVEPRAGFTARINARVAASPRPSHGVLPYVALAACMVLVVAAMSSWRETGRFEAESLLPHRDLIVLSQPPRVTPSPPPPRRRSHASMTASAVVVSRSEMLALQRLFVGTLTAPPPLPAPAPASELSIPKLAIAPLLMNGPEGERQ